MSSLRRMCLQKGCLSTSGKIVQEKLPICKWLPNYSWNCFQGDLIAGITVGLTVIPQGLAYASIAQLPPQYGLYSSFIGCFVYTLMGSSKDITLGPTAIMSLMVATFASPPVTNDPTVAILLSLVTGFIQLIMSVCNAGFIINFISTPVMSSFVTSAAITIAFGQISKIMGIANIPKSFFKQIYWLFVRAGETNVFDVILGSTVFFILLALKHLKSKFVIANNPSYLMKFIWVVGTARNAIVVLLSSAMVAYTLHLGFDPFTRTPAVVAGLPDFSTPSFSLHSANVTMNTKQMLEQIGSGMFIVPLIGFIETIAIGKAFARQNKYSIDANQELLAIGVANMVGSFFGAYPVTGSFSRTAINSQSGVQTPGGGVFTGCLIMLALLIFTPYMPYIPGACLAAVIVVAVIDMTNFKMVSKLWHVNKLDLIPWSVTFIFSFIMGIEYGIIFGVLVSLLMLLYPTSRPKIKIVQNRVVTFELRNGLLFPAIDYVIERVTEESVNDDIPKSAILDMTHVSDVDLSSLQGLKSLAEDFHHRKTVLVVTNVHADILDSIMKLDMEFLKIAHSIEDANQLIYEEYHPNEDNVRQSLLGSSDVERTQVKEEV